MTRSLARLGHNRGRPVYLAPELVAWARLGQGEGARAIAALCRRRILPGGSGAGWPPVINPQKGACPMAARCRRAAPLRRHRARDAFARTEEAIQAADQAEIEARAGYRRAAWAVRRAARMHERAAELGWGMCSGIAGGVHALQLVDLAQPLQGRPYGVHDVLVQPGRWRIIRIGLRDPHEGHRARAGDRTQGLAASGQTPRRPCPSKAGPHDRR
ncbi:hypothetical protein Psi01_57380 [Planobispora siamensis]|uniref:Uncharacterized protein n=1 Tax=Planobispora siamensis TaxID=936338 RepID=A0A8J3SIR1_9ACTN|nr:hypothetical protein Psi01_57380 [Planobispora siamensis]